MVEDKNIAHEGSFLDPTGKSGELKSENDELATQINNFPGKIQRIKMLKVTTIQMRISKEETQSTSCSGPSTLNGQAYFLR